MPGESATQTEMDVFGNGGIRLQNVDTTSNGTAIACFAGGTRIATPNGARAVEDLRAGDLVLTRDGAPQPIVWMSHSVRRWPGSPIKDLPIEIKAHALGPGRPARDLVVSPQHRVLAALGDPCTGTTVQVLVPAKALLDMAGVRVMTGKRGGVS